MLLINEADSDMEMNAERDDQNCQNASKWQNLAGNRVVEGRLGSPPLVKAVDDEVWKGAP